VIVGDRNPCPHMEKALRLLPEGFSSSPLE